jgi:hypothetical protein
MSKTNTSRMLSLLGALACGWAATLGVTEQAQAQAVGRAPWCVDMGVLGNGYLECQYYTWEQCRARASGVSNNACFRNPWYRPERVPVRRPRDDRYR